MPPATDTSERQSAEWSDMSEVACSSRIIDGSPVPDREDVPPHERASSYRRPLAIAHELAFAHEHPMTAPLTVVVAEIVAETPNIRTFTLKKLDGSPFTPFSAGAHVDVIGPTGILRQYSLASDPDRSSSIAITVKLEPESRGGSAALHQVKVGDHLRIGKPRNLLEIAEPADRHLLVAGGVGVTPLLSMAYALHSRGADFSLHYFVRAREDAAFADLLEHRAEFRDRVTLHTNTPRELRLGLLSSLASGLTAESHVYTCGPVGFMEMVREACEPVVGEANVHIEHFASAEFDRSGDRPFDVEVAGTGTFHIPANRTILSVLEEQGVEVFKSCEEGVCGSCVAGVLEGVPEHRDHCLSAADKKAGAEIALCVSRSLSDRLVIDLY